MPAETFITICSPDDEPVLAAFLDTDRELIYGLDIEALVRHIGNTTGLAPVVGATAYVERIDGEGLIARYVHTGSHRWDLTDTLFSSEFARLALHG